MLYTTNAKIEEKNETKIIKDNLENLKSVIKDIFSKDKKRIQKQIPNILTLIRGIIAPIIIIQSLVHNNLYLAIVLIGICSLTDCLDGWYARKYNVKSEFGALLDTICDKVFSISILAPIVFVSPKLIISILILEAIIAIINSYFKLKGVNTSSSKIGKAKTIILYLTILFFYLSLFINIEKFVLKGIAVFTIIMQSITAIDYFRKYRREDEV